MADEIYDMYTADLEETSQDKPLFAPTVRQNEFTMEIRVGDQKFAVINPEYVTVLQRRLVDLETKIKSAENDIRNLKADLRQKDSIIKAIASKLNTGFTNNGSW